METAIYRKHGEISIIEVEGALSKIRTPDDEFWVRTKDLRPISLPHQPILLPVVLSEIAEFAAYLVANGYSLHVEATSLGAETASEEYQLWAAELLPVESLKIYENRPKPREWRLQFAYKQEMACPFPIVEEGTCGGVGCSTARGLHKNGHVKVNYAGVVEQLVRAGLRAGSHSVPPPLFVGIACQN